ncbi:MAG: type IV secretion system DNA-binding domain-containing protein [Candidatus Pacebacteria bacterium]|nr:type IV secretion system DNA-binding domain-containing protein [Candidatus Paceibacterota bacterium]
MADHSHHDDHEITTKAPHMDHANDERRITYFATTHTRGKREMFGIRAVDRGKHIYVIGKTGMGKSTMLENLAIQDIQNGEGLAFIDPHGSTAEKLLDFIPQERINDVVYFAPFDIDYPMGFNVMEDVGYDKRHLIVSGLMGAFERIWEDQWSARMAYILQNVMLALLEYPGSSLLDVNRMLTNKTYRDAVIEKVTDPIVKAFWTEEFASFTDRYTAEATPAIQNKIGQFIANPLIRHIVGQSTSSFDLRKIMDEKKIFIVNLSKGRMGETNAALLGSMLTVKIYLAAMSRADEPASRMAKLPRFYFYVDEFQSMMNKAFADILSESRKYKLALTLANQYIEQMDEEVRDAVFGNVGTLIVFRVGPFDAEVLETVFQPTFLPEDLVGLGIGQIYLTLMIDGVGSPPFSAETIAPIEAPAISYRNDVVTASRATYSRSRADIVAEINRKQTEFVAPSKEKKDRRDGPPRSSNGWNAAPQGGTTPREKFAAAVSEVKTPPAAPHSPAPAPAPAPAPQAPVAAPVQRPTLQDKIREIQAPRPLAQNPRGSVVPTPARPREAQPRSPDIHAKREAEAVQHRNALKDAIEQARAERHGAPAKSPLDLMREKNASKMQSRPEVKPQEKQQEKAPQRQEVRQHERRDVRQEIRREETTSERPHERHAGQHAARQAQSAPQAPHTEHASRQFDPAEPVQRERSRDEGADPERPRAETNHTRPSHEHVHHGEVSHRELQRVLNGTDRDSDDL